MQYRDMRISVRMFLDDFINPPLRDYVVFYLEKVEKNEYDEIEVETKKAKGEKCPVCWKINSTPCERHSK